MISGNKDVTLFNDYKQLLVFYFMLVYFIYGLLIIKHELPFFYNNYTLIYVQIDFCNFSIYISATKYYMFAPDRASFILLHTCNNAYILYITFVSLQLLLN